MDFEKELERQIDSIGEIQGTEQIANEFNPNSKSWIIALLRRLEARGVIHIIRSSGGRGHKTIYRRNRNSPGQPRKQPRNS